MSVLPWLHYSLFPVLGNALFPPHCALCHADASAPHSLCAECFSAITFITDPMCGICGQPFGSDALPDVPLCAPCMTKAPPYDLARSAIQYNEASKGLITRIKYSDRTDIVPLAAQLMAAAGHEVLAGAEVLVPVPLHWRRMLQRRFNQSQLLALRLQRQPNCQAVLVEDALKRVKHTPPQASLSWKDRQKNVKSVFTLNPKRKAVLEGKRVVLIDDVMTTGATIRACARLLKQSGAAQVSVLTLARRLLHE